LNRLYRYFSKIIFGGFFIDFTPDFKYLL